MEADHKRFWEYVSDTTQDKVSDLSPEKLREYYAYFAQAHFETPEIQPQRHRAAAERLELLRGELERCHANTRHEQSQTLGGKTLTWARVGGIAGLVAVLIAAATLLAQIYFPKAPPSTPATASPTSSLQTPATISESPVQAADSSSATPSLSPAAETTPRDTP